MNTLVWWGRSDTNYSRNRVMRELLQDLGWKIIDFHPRLSVIAHWEAAWKNLPAADLIWVPCFRQRDMPSALRFARRQGTPVVFDPLISAYDKQVNEQHKLPIDSVKAVRLRAWESRLFRGADMLLADTSEHARYFGSDLGVAPNRVAVVHVGAEESHFLPQKIPQRDPGSSLRVLFYGSFLPLHGPMVIIEAARLCRHLPVIWTLLGDGALKSECLRASHDLEKVEFRDWARYDDLPAIIHNHDVVLGVFGDTPKAGRVIPNKVFQALACGRPVITRTSPAYPSVLASAPKSGLIWVAAGDPAALAAIVSQIVDRRSSLPDLGMAARITYEHHFSRAKIKYELSAALQRLGFS